MQKATFNMCLSVFNKSGWSQAVKNCLNVLPACDLDCYFVGLNVIYLDILYTLTNDH